MRFVWFLALGLIAIVSSELIDRETEDIQVPPGYFFGYPEPFERNLRSLFIAEKKAQMEKGQFPYYRGLGR